MLLSVRLIEEWKSLGLKVKFINNDTQDVVVENDVYCIYFDRLNKSKPYAMTTNSTLQTEVVKLCYLTLKELNDILYHENDIDEEEIIEQEEIKSEE